MPTLNFKNHKTGTGIAILVCILLHSCHNTPAIDLEKEKMEILKLDADQRQYHFTKNARSFVDMFSNGFLSISKGSIDKPGSKDSYKRFDNYFKNVEFIKWDNNKEPIIRFSDDATVAYTAVDKTVIVKMKDSAGKDLMDTTNFAWLALYKKNNGKWELDCIASTNK